MNRKDFHKLFKSPGPVVLPVVHVLDSERTEENLIKIIQAGAHGCFLINHDFEPERFLPIIRDMRNRFPSLWIGVNFLAVTGKDAFPVLAKLADEGCQVDAYWADDACIDEHGENSAADAIEQARADCGWQGLYFGGTAFKKQRDVDPAHYADAAREARPYMDVVTTSGIATGHEADLGKIETFRAAIGEQTLALASGIDPTNAQSYADVDCFMVATGINQDDNFYDIDLNKLTNLLAITRKLGTGKSL